MKMNRLMSVIVLICIPLILGGCETFHELQTPVQPQTFTQSLAATQGQIKALRSLTVFILKSENQNCKVNPATDLCTAAAKIDEETTKFRDQIDLVNQAYAAAGGVLTECTITYGGVSMPCQSTEDHILAGLITLQSMLPDGSKQ